MNKYILYILFINVSICFTSCNIKENGHSEYIPANQELKILLADPVETLDPLKILYDSDWKVASNIFEGLLTFDENNQVKKELVDSFIISDDNLIYNFILKDNIYFQDSPCFLNGIGRKLNAYDVQYTFERLATKNNNFPNWQTISEKIVGINNYNSGKNNRIKGIIIEDSLSFQIKLSQPFSAFLKVLASPNFYIIPHEAISYYKDRFEDNPIGTGPFRISEYKKYERIILVKNENYYMYDKNQNRLPHLKSIEYRTIEESESRFGELVKNKTHFINTSMLELNKFAQDSLLLKNYTVKNINKGVGIRYWGFYFDQNGDTKNYKTLRQQIVTSFNRDFLENTEYSNVIANTLVPEHFFNDDKNRLFLNNKTFTQRNLDKNIQYDTIILMGNMEYLDLIKIEKTLDELNLPYKRLIKPDNYYGEIRICKPTLFRVSMVPSFPDPIEYYSLFYSKNSASVNLGNFSNEEYDRIYEYVQTENNLSSQKEAYIKMEKILKNEVAAIYLTHRAPINYIFSKNLKQTKYSYILPDFRESYFE